MLKITRRIPADDSARVLLQLEGQVTGPWVDALRRACDESGGNGKQEVLRLVLELSAVSFIDAKGVALFRELAARGVKLSNGSIYVAEQLKEVPHDNG